MGSETTAVAISAVIVTAINTSSLPAGKLRPYDHSVLEHLKTIVLSEALCVRISTFDWGRNNPTMSGSIKGSLENVVKGKLVLKGGKGVGGGAGASKPVGICKEAEAPRLVSSGPKVYDTRTPYEKVRSERAIDSIFKHFDALFQKVADARSKRELEQLRTVSAKSHKQRLEVRTCSALRLHNSLLLTHHPPGVQRQTIFAPRNQRNTQRCRRWMSVPVIDPPPQRAQSSACI